MNNHAHADHLSQLDDFRSNFEHAKTRLAMQAHGLADKTASAQQLQWFIEAAYELIAVCEESVSRQCPLEVLFWFRKKLLAEVGRTDRTYTFLARCNREVRRVEASIQQTCDRLAQGKVVPLLSS